TLFPYTTLFRSPRDRDTVDGAGGSSEGLREGGPQFGGGLDDLAPGAQHRRRVVAGGVHEELAGGEGGVQEQFADAALVLPFHGVASRTRSQMATTSGEIPAVWSRTGMARVSSSAERNSCAMSSCAGRCPSRSAPAGSMATAWHAAMWIPRPSRCRGDRGPSASACAHARTAAWRSSRATAARVSPASWSIVSFVITGPAPCLVRVVIPIQPSRPVLVPAFPGGCG